MIFDIARDQTCFSYALRAENDDFGFEGLLCHGRLVGCLFVRVSVRVFMFVYLSRGGVLVVEER